MKTKKAFINGTIYTVDPQSNYVEAVITLRNKIIFVGSRKEAENFIDRDTEVIDLNGKLMLPGFIDSHSHLVMGGQFLLNVNLTKVKSKSEFCEKLRDYITTNPNKWIIGGNWNHQNWGRIELPDKSWIDSFTSDIPVFISRMDYHLALANSYVMKLAGIDRNTQNPKGGEIVKDEFGEPTGILKDKAMDLVYRVIPDPSYKEYDDAVDAAMSEVKRLGITSVHDICYDKHFPALERAEKSGKLNARVYSSQLIKNYKNLISNNIQYNNGDGKLKTGTVKAFADGSLGSQTAYMFQPYSSNQDNVGLLMEEMANGQLEKMIQESDLNKLQCCIHAIGDRAISELLDIIEKLVEKNPDWDRRFRIEHAQHINNSDIKRVAKLGVIVSAQPYHIYDDGCWAEDVIGKERLKNFYAFRTIIDSGIKLCFGSDWSVSTMDPIWGIYVAVTRKVANNRYPAGMIPEEKISVDEAIKLYTINGAFAIFQEDKVGSIEVGKIADMVVLSENILKIEPERIRNVKVEMTIFDGKIIYTA